MCSTNNVKDIHSTTLGNGCKLKQEMLQVMLLLLLKQLEYAETEAECIGWAYDETEFDKNVWTVGEPEILLLVLKDLDTVRLTCADIVNRIPDVINARPGFVPSEMPDPKI